MWCAVSDVNEILISANRSLADYAPRGQVVTDAELNVAAEGPLMGVLAGLRSAGTPWLLTCPGDTPYLDTNWHHALIAQAVGANPRSLAFTVHDGERLQPLHTLVRIQAHDHLLAYLTAGKRSSNRLVERPGYRARALRANNGLRERQPCSRSATSAPLTNLRL